MIGGKPGAGKSTVVKMFIDRMASARDCHCCYMPLKHFPTIEDATKLLVALPPIDTTLLLVYDGLDEILMSGESAERLATAFLEGVDQNINRVRALAEKPRCRLKVLVTGRSAVLGLLPSQFKSRTVHLFPYVADNLKHYQDSQGLLEEDKRDRWWKAYGSLTGKGFERMPSELKDWDARRGDKRPLAATPILNLLIALSYDELDFSTDSNIANIYKELLRGIFHRDYGDWPAKNDVRQKSTGGHRLIAKVEFSDYLRFLEQLGLAAWQAPHNLVSLEDLKHRSEAQGLSEVFTRFQKDEDAGIRNLTFSFYVKYSAEGNRSELCGFVHRSFMEYLVSRSIRRLVDECFTEDKGLSECQRKELFEALSKVALNEHILDFLESEYACYVMDVKAECAEKQQQQRFLGELVEKQQRLLGELVDSIAMPQLVLGSNERLPFMEEKKALANYQIALLAVHSCIAMQTESVTPLAADAIAKGFYNWLVEVAGHFPVLSPIPRRCLNHIAFKVSPVGKEHDFAGANLQGANLQRINLQRTHLQGANLQGANLKRANLKRANLQDAHLQNVELYRAHLQGADLQRADLRYARLRYADLQRADLRYAYLQHAHLQSADLQHVDLRYAYLLRAYSQDVCLQDADLQEAHLQDASFQRADLQRADFRGADLRGADFLHADFRGANLQNANLRGANYRKEDLEGALL